PVPYLPTGGRLIEQVHRNDLAAYRHGDAGGSLDIRQPLAELSQTAPVRIVGVRHGPGQRGRAEGTALPSHLLPDLPLIRRVSSPLVQRARDRFLEDVPHLGRSMAAA